jgi:hypothetical protein
VSLRNLAVSKALLFFLHMMMTMMKRRTREAMLNRNRERRVYLSTRENNLDRSKAQDQTAYPRFLQLLLIYVLKNESYSQKLKKIGLKRNQPDC